MFVTETSRDPLLARSDRLIRLGGGTAPLGLCLIAITGRLVGLPKPAFDAIMLALLAIGQALVWRGMHGVRRARGWRSGVVAYAWAGGIMSGWAIAFTGYFPLALIPLAAPAWATFARWRTRRGEG